LKEWKEIRQLYKDGNLDRIAQLEQLVHTEQSDDDNGGKTEPLPAVMRIRGFAPTDARASAYFNLLTKCRKCHWYSYTSNFKKLAHRDRIVEHHPAEWCLACGRIASKKCCSSSGKPKCQVYQPKPKDVHISTKTIPFRIKVHDPRKMNMFRANWNKLEGSSPQWTYDEAEAEEDMFHHRFGTHPSLPVILASISPLREDTIPTDGMYQAWNMRWVQCEMNRESSGSRGYHHYSRADDEIPVARAEETDAILMDKKDRLLFQELYKFRSIGFPPREKPQGSIVGDVEAKWNSETRCGVSTKMSTAESCDMVPFSLYSLLLVGVCGSHLSSPKRSCRSKLGPFAWNFV
jgi:hypothetical protein